MKRNYIAPAMTEINIETEVMIAESLPIGGSGSGNLDTSVPGTQLGGGRRGEWGNLWK